MVRSMEAGTHRLVAAMAVDPVERGGGEQGHPQAAVGAEALLGGEVVGVELGRVDPEPAGSRRGVDRHQAAAVGGAAAPSGRRMGIITPVEVSLWVRA